MNGKDILKVFANVDATSFNRYKREIYLAAVLVLVTFAFYRFVYQRDIREIAAIDQQIALENAEIGTFSAQIQASQNLRRGVDEASKNLKRAEQRLTHLKERLPSDKNIARVLYEISDGELSRTGGRINAIKPLPPEEQGDILRIPIQVSMDTRFSAFGEYLERIEGLTRVIIVDNFLLESKEDASGRLTAQVYLSAYIMGANK